MWFLCLVVFAIQSILSSTGIILQGGNPEAYMNISEIIHHKGYQVEEYEIATSDGYILTLNRIPHGRKQHWSLSGKPVVLLQHGLCLEGRVWVANMPNQSLAFMLADTGYDVWIGNNRGNSWSRKHQHLTFKQDQYHAYSFDEMGRYDLPAMISFIVKKTTNSKIHLVGYSQGAAQGLIALSSMPHMAEKIKMFHALSPATTLKNSQNPLIKLLFLPDAAIKGLLGRRDFFLRNEVLRKMVIRKCSSIMYNKLCSQFISFIGGYNEKNLNLSRMDVYMSYFPDSTSIQNILHWGQIYKTGKFRAFDYGNGNKERYNQDQPPSYNVERITVPISIWYGENDQLVTPDNVKGLIDQLHSVVYKTSLSDWTHFDFIWGLDASKRVYEKKIYRIIVLAYLIRGLTGYEELIGQKCVNPEVYMNVSQMISHQGYPSEEYKVLTEDGYYLTINRIPRGRKNIADIDGKPVVFLQHGIFGEASHWVENMANNSLGFILADENCDVWLGNSRGTSWSQRQRSFSVDQEDFWNFSFHEMAMYDLPATINFILKKTKKKQLYYVGHSQGATIGFIAFSAMPELSHKIKMFLVLAPVIYVTHVPDLLLRLLSSFPQHPFKQILGNKDFMFTHKPMKYFMKNLCTIEFMHQLCPHLIFLPGTYNATNLNMILDTEMFRYFDYGNKNQMIYKQSVPPSYQIKDMVVPTAVWSGGQDTIAEPEDIELLLSHIVNLVYHRSWSDWTHLDFIWGLNARECLFFKII